MLKTHTFLLLAILITATSLSGAADPPTWMFWKKKVDPNAPPTPTARMKEMKELCERADKMSVVEKEQKSEELVKAANSESDVMVRAQIMRTLGAFPSLHANTTLYSGLQDSDPDIRIACCEAWGKRGGPDAAKVLGEILAKDEDLDVRMAAVRALGEVKDKSAVAPLGTALDDSNPALQVRAVRSLEKVTGKHFGDDITAWKTFVQGGNPREESLVSRIRRTLF